MRHRNRLVGWWHDRAVNGRSHWHFWPYPTRHSHAPLHRSCDHTHG